MHLFSTETLNKERLNIAQRRFLSELIASMIGGEVRELSSLILHRVLGDDYKRIINLAFVRCDSYIVGRKCFSYKIRPLVEINAPEHREAVRAIDKANRLGNFSFNKGVFSAISEMPKHKQQIAYHDICRVCEIASPQDLFISTSEKVEGRECNLFCCIAKELRHFLTYRGLTATEIDITSSQVRIISNDILKLGQAPDELLWKDLVNGGKIYARIADDTGLTLKQAKKGLNAAMNSDLLSNKFLNEERGIVSDYIKINFPSIASHVYNYAKTHGRKQLGIVAMGLEARAINLARSEFNASGLIAVSVYDALLVFTEDLAKVNAIFTKALESTLKWTKNVASNLFFRVKQGFKQTEQSNSMKHTETERKKETKEDNTERETNPCFCVPCALITPAPDAFFKAYGIFEFWLKKYPFFQNQRNDK